MNKTLFSNLLSVCGCVLFLFSTAFSQSAAVSGTIKDRNGAAIVEARISVLSSNGTVLQTNSTDGEGYFSLKIPAGAADAMLFAADGFESQKINLQSLTPNSALQITPAPAALRAEITVTANRGLTTEVEAAASVLNLRERKDLLAQPLPTVGNALV
jgi:hypothetical protein